MILPALVTADQLTVTQANQVAWASGEVRRYCEWHIAPQLPHSEQLDTGDGRTLALRSMHVVSVQSVTYDSDSATADLAALSNELRRIGLLQRRDRGPWLRREAGVTVKYTHGYADVPPELAAVVVAVAKRMPAQMAAVRQETAGGVTRQYGGDLAGGFASAGFTASEMTTLDKFKLWPAP